MDALYRIKHLSNEGGGYCVIIDIEFEKTDHQYKKLYDFYNSFGFEILDEEKSSRRLYLPVKEIPDIL